MITSREIRLKSRPVGMPSAENFELATVSVPHPARGEVQVENLWMTVDPYMRNRMAHRASYTSSVPARQGGAPWRDRGDRRVQLDHVRLAPAPPAR